MLEHPSGETVEAELEDSPDLDRIDHGDDLKR